LVESLKPIASAIGRSIAGDVEKKRQITVVQGIGSQTAQRLTLRRKVARKAVRG